MPSPRKELREYIEAVKQDRALAQEFADAVKGAAKKAGYDLDAAEVLKALIDTQPSQRPLPKDEEDGPRVTTLALGEEEKKQPPRDRPHITTLAVGEEDKGWPRPPREPQVTSAALGEEGNPPAPPRRPPVTTMAVGEEGNPRR